MEFGLIGRRLGHSYSPELHHALGGYDYVLQELEPEALPGFLAARRFRGVNVTLPYKQAVIPFLDELSPIARRIGAVNTIVNRGGRLFGDNTDYAGMLALVRRCGLAPKDRTVLILGSGGTSRTAKTVMEDLGAARVFRVSRHPGPDTIGYAEASAMHAGASLLVNTTPVGMYPHEGASPIDLSAFPQLDGVLDAVYHPLRTAFVQDAQARGIPAMGGLYMLTAQAVRAAELFLGRSLAPSVFESVYASLLRNKENVVLIGMPTCGKTTVGKLLSRSTGRVLIDTDALLTRRLGSIPAFIEQYGEGVFRQEESAAVAECARESGAVIATGGGAVLSEENVRVLKQNGTLVFLDRPLDRLRPSADRPLSASPEALQTMYAARRPLYLRAADRVIPAVLPPDAVAEAIRKELNL